MCPNIFNSDSMDFSDRRTVGQNETKVRQNGTKDNTLVYIICNNFV